MSIRKVFFDALNNKEEHWVEGNSSIKHAQSWAVQGRVTSREEGHHGGQEL